MAAGSEHDVYSFEPFTRHGFYDDVNRALVEEGIRRLPSPAAGSRTIVDLSCGTGAMTLMVIEVLRSRGLDATIIGVEPSSDALARAESRVAGAGMRVRFVQGGVTDLTDTLPSSAVDALFFGNAINLVNDKDEALRQIAGVLVPGGVLAFNSAFFDGAYAPGSETYYRLWTVRAMRWLRREHPRIRLSREEKTAARQWLSKDEYEASLRRHGFNVLHSALDQVRMDLASFQDIGRYWLFIEGALPGAPLAAGAEALAHGAAEAFEELGLEYVPRNWLQVVATLGGGAASPGHGAATA
jgi:ubiquinone/menaquinone biosynthesis C-methylase UbiE